MPKRPPVTGQQLINDFQTAVLAIATSQAAHHEAERSETELVQHLRDLSSGNFLQPGLVAQGEENAVTRASLDAHIKKVQAEQLGQLSSQQLVELQQHASSDYIHRKVRVTVTNPDAKPLETLWFDQRNGHRSSVRNSRVVSGTIEDVLLDRNALLIKPPLMARLLNSRLQNFVVYVIDPETFQPAVDITVL